MRKTTILGGLCVGILALFGFLIVPMVGASAGFAPSFQAATATATAGATETATVGATTAATAGATTAATTMATTAATTAATTSATTMATTAAATATTSAPGALPNTGAGGPDVLPLVLGAAALLVAGFTAVMAVLARRRSTQ